MEASEYLMLAGTKIQSTTSTTRAARSIGTKISAIIFSAIPSAHPLRLIVSQKMEMTMHTASPATMKIQVPTTSMSSEKILVPNMCSLLIGGMTRAQASHNVTAWRTSGHFLRVDHTEG